MLNRCDVSWRDSIFEYIGDNYSECLYLYINLNKYGFENENFNIWVSLNPFGEITALLAKYYTGINIYSKEHDYLIDDIIEFISHNQPSIINGTGQLIKNIEEYLPDYIAEFGSIGQLRNVADLDTNSVEIASINDMSKIAELLINDIGLGGHYEAQLLEHQLKERYKEGFGRNYIIRKNNIIVSHCATYAEIDNICVTSGVFTKPEERGKGFAYQIYCKLCSDLLKEKKEIYAYYYTFQAHKMHEKVGFQIISEWGKLTKNTP